MNYVIIGNSTAAAGCIEGIRQVDQEGPVTVVSAENRPVYSRPLISYLLQGKTTLEGMMYRGADFYQKNGCVLLGGKSAVKIDPRARTVTLDDGRVLPYGKLLVATGSVPFTPPMKGLDSIGAFSFLSLNDALALEKTLEARPRVLIIGAGLIGTKCAEGIAARAGSVTVLELAPRILPTALDEKGAALIQAHIEAQGVRFVLGDQAELFTPRQGGPADAAGKPLGGSVRTVNGEVIEFDVLVTAVGVRPNTDLLREAGGKVNRGAVTDESMRTSLPDVWAAGDCAESFDITSGEHRVLALLPNAYFQGESAGITMAGAEKPFQNAFPMNAAGFFGLHLVTAGSYAGEGVEAPAGTEDEPGYKKFFVDKGLLRGFIIIGDTSRAGIYTSLIRERTPLASIDFDLLKTSPALMAFSKSARAEMLSGGPHERD
ncbi:MAG: FAD-dependent oxidoreductase [Spirochaetaceae bacterium]|jgi:NAD(P)H-nitrite reductase large subunit|nr:FAD-dependent oxidoreductase [Spirochaetaceae bacterium]